MGTTQNARHSNSIAGLLRASNKAVAGLKEMALEAVNELAAEYNIPGAESDRNVLFSMREILVKAWDKADEQKTVDERIGSAALLVARAAAGEGLKGMEIWTLKRFDVGMEYVPLGQS